jgi:cystathionine beta-lyase
MAYDFDQAIERRGTACSKWDTLEGSDILPMWVADMDLVCPNPVVEAIKARAAHPVYGYSIATEGVYDAIQGKMLADHGWRVEREWIRFTPGVVSALYPAIRACTQPGDNVMIQEPAYFPFFTTIPYCGCTVNSNPLVRDGERYVLDFEGMTKNFDERTKAMLFCSPHNPTGRVWSRDELECLAALCLERDCAIISDEIHCDIVRAGSEHTVLATLGKEVERRTITLMSPSKTYNIAGLSAAVAIIPDEGMRARYDAAATAHGVNLFGYVGIEAAYRDGAAYRGEMLAYIEGNMDLFLRLLGEQLPMLKAYKPEGTYLMWVDMSALGMAREELNRFIAQDCRVKLNDGESFGKGGEGFQRFNMACPRANVEEAVRRLREGFARR